MQVILQIILKYWRKCKQHKGTKWTCLAQEQLSMPTVHQKGLFCFYFTHPSIFRTVQGHEDLYFQTQVTLKAKQHILNVNGKYENPRFD